MSSRDSMTVWLPKELYSSVEPLADQRYIWCPMPFDDSLPVEQTSFIHMGGDDEDDSTHKTAVKSNPAGYDDGSDTAVEDDLSLAPPSIDVLDGSTDISSSETESEKEFPFRKISQNISRGKRRPRKTQPLRRGHSKHEGEGRHPSRASRGFAVHLGLNLDVEVTLKARVNGDLELSML